MCTYLLPGVFVFKTCINYESALVPYGLVTTLVDENGEFNGVTMPLDISLPWYNQKNVRYMPYLESESRRRSFDVPKAKTWLILFAEGHWHIQVDTGEISGSTKTSWETTDCPVFKATKTCWIPAQCRCYGNRLLGVLDHPNLNGNMHLRKWTKVIKCIGNLWLPSSTFFKFFHLNFLLWS